MKMFKSIGTWMACVAMLSSGLMAQEAPKTNPIEVKEQNGEVLGSLGQTVNKVIPSVNIDMGLHTKQYKHGVLWDKNANADLDINFSWMPVQNGILSIGLNGRVPLEDSKRKLSSEQSQTPFVEQISKTKKNSVSKNRDGDLDAFELRVLYTHQLKDVIPYINEMNISAGWTYYRLNNIYSKISEKYTDHIWSNYAKEMGKEYTKETGQEIDGKIYEEYIVVDKYTYKWRDISRQELKLAVSLDNILKSDTYIFTPNMSINFETAGYFWMQYGVKFDMPINVISSNLKWKNSVDTYWFSKNYFKMSSKFENYVENPNGKRDNEATDLYHKVDKSRSAGWTDPYTSKSGFKTINIQTSLDYAINSNISISPYVSAIWYCDSLIGNSEDKEYYFITDDFIVWYGIYLKVNF